MKSEAFSPYGELERIGHFTVVGKCSAPYSWLKNVSLGRGENVQERFVLQYQCVIVLH